MTRFIWRYSQIVVAGALLMLCAQVALPQAQARATGAAVITGWPGGLTTYQGRYKIMSSSNMALATSGTLTIFGRVVPHQAHPQMSGIFSLYSADGTNVLYLTHFTTTAGKRAARVVLGIYTGPLIGTLNVSAFKSNQLVVVIKQLNGTQTDLTLTRTSNNPHP